MISVWHLLWIVPVSVYGGMFLAALVAGDRGMDEEGTNGSDKT